METRKLGSLSVSAVGVGCNQFGTRSCDEATAIRVIHEALDAGITYFDTADEYGQNYFVPEDTEGWGRSEEILGKALKGRRDEAVIATKFWATPHGDDGSRGGASARWIRIAIEDSLRRLGTDRVDLYQQHFPDPNVPIDETLGALDELVRAGKVREIGCCNFTGDMLHEAADVSAAKGIAHFVSVQSPLNLIQRQSLMDPIPTCQQLGLSFIPYYPLASGMLTGKYRRDDRPSSGTRLTEQVTAEAQEKLFSDKSFRRIEALERFATDRGHSLLELAFAWLLSVPSVATVIAGAAKPGQPSANAAAASWRLSAEEVALAVEAVMAA